jgi:DNA modification methylase
MTNGGKMKRQILIGDVLEQLKTLPDESIQTVVTSPPYWGLRDYGNDGQIGLEQTPQEYIDKMVEVFREVKRVLRDDGTLWLNIGDSYSGSGKGPAGNLGKKHNERHLEQKTGGIVPEGTKPKDLVGIPWMLAFGLRADGWYLRQDIIWAKPNVMPESVRDRCTKSHEYLFLLTKSPKYYYDHIAIKEPVSEVSLKRALSGWKTNRPSAKTSPQGIDVEVMGKRFVNPEGRNKRDVWFIPTASYKGAHFAVMPEKLVEPCILAGSREDDVVLDPFMGSGTVGVVAERHNRHFVGIELNPEYVKLALTRLDGKGPTLWG